MKAWMLHGVGKIELEEIPQPIVRNDEVLLSVKACGICGSDIPRIYTTGAHNMPLIPGHEFSGEVVQIGAEVHRAWLGKRVGVFPLIPCQRCPACMQKKYELCSGYDYLGSRRNGAFAEYVAVPAWNLLELPDAVSYEEAAMLEPMAVAVHAMRRVALRASDTVLVYGAGTIGMLLTMFLLERHQNAAFVVGNKPFQREMLMRLGLPEPHYCDITQTDVPAWVHAQTQGQGADAVFECVGKCDTISQSIQCAKREGHICTVGNPHTDILLERNTYWNILRKQMTVTGTWNSSFKTSQDDDWKYVVQKLARGAIQPRYLITHRFPVQRLEEGLRSMRDKTQNYVKIMMIPQ